LLDVRNKNREIQVVLNSKGDRETGTPFRRREVISPIYFRRKDTKIWTWWSDHGWGG